MTRPTYSYPTMRRCLRRVASGETISGVARSEGIAFSTVQRWCTRQGVTSAHPFPFRRIARPKAPKAPRAHPPAVRESVVRAVQDGASYGDAARAEHVHLHTVKRWCARAGVRSRYAQGSNQIRVRLAA